VRSITILRDKSRKEGFFKLLFKGLQANVGLSSVLAAVSLPIFTAIFDNMRIIMVIVTILVAVLLVVQHRSNIIKLVKGEQK
jgi:glycerol-3-phosphate acyltransferase PlsY